MGELIKYFKQDGEKLGLSGKALIRYTHKQLKDFRRQLEKQKL